MATSGTTIRDPRHHTWPEDVLAITTGTLLVAIGLVLFNHARLASGGTAGMAFIIHYLTDWPYGPVLFVTNLPFYVFTWRFLGAEFALKTFAAVTLLSVEMVWIPRWLVVSDVQPVFASFAGAIFIGFGLLALVRHRSSLGGIGAICFWVQERYGWRAGKVQLAIDSCIVLAASVALTPVQVAISLAGAILMNVFLTLNHKPGRYTGL